MLKKLHFISPLLIIILNGIIIGQNYSCILKGRVLETNSGKPLENVNVYISGTTWGTSTDQYGNYLISNVPPGNHVLVASIIGYKPASKDVVLKNGMIKQINFNLDETKYELQNVEVTGSTPDEWKHNLEIFRKRFLGASKIAGDCIIQNPEIIDFKWIGPSVLKATASQPIKIINNALGYKISCILVNFLWDSEEYKLQILVRPSFKALKDTTGKLKQKWDKNRIKAFSGSLDDFLQAAKDNKLKENGFQVYLDTGPESVRRNLHHLYGNLTRKMGEDYALTFSDYLKVEYILNDPANPETSWIKLMYPMITLDKFGYPIEPLPFQVFGYWTKLGIADMLPKYYIPPDSLKVIKN